jgi:hypothetical protein
MNDVTKVDEGNVTHVILREALFVGKNNRQFFATFSRVEEHVVPDQQAVCVWCLFIALQKFW